MSSSSEEGQYEPPKTPGSEVDQEAQQEPHKQLTFIQALAKVFHEPEIPLEDKVILGPLDKYRKYSKSDRS